MVKMYRALLSLGIIAIFIFLLWRTYHVFKWSNVRGITLIMAEKICRKEEFLIIPKKYLKKRNLCLIKGTYINPGIFVDKFYIPISQKSPAEIKGKWILNFYKPE